MKKALLPSSQCQFGLAWLLWEELKGLGISDVSLDEHCYVYSSSLLQKVWSTAKHWALSLIWIRFPISVTMQSHRWSEDYDGKELLSAQGRELFPGNVPRILLPLPGVPDHLRRNHDPGADDKAGIAEILTALEHILTEKYLTDLSASLLLRMKKSAWDRPTLM